MKKVLLIIFSFFIFPVLTFAVDSDDVDYKVTNYFIKANIQENGDLKVKELIVLKGTFNGYERTINYRNSNLSGYNDVDFEHSAIYNSDGIKDVKISAKYMSNNISFDDIDDTDYESFTESSYVVSGSKRKYTLREGYDGNTYRMYYESRNKKVGFLVEYTLENAVVMHNDVAELYWQIFSIDPENDTYRDLKVKVYLPGEDTNETFRFWAHGPLSGTINAIGDENYYEGSYAKVEKFDNEEDFDIRMTFNKSLITDDTLLDHTNVDAFDEILEVEEQRAADANAERERLKKIFNGYKIASQIITGAIALGFIIIKFITRKPRVDFDAQYYREFIEDYNVEVIDYLYKKSLTPNALSAAIMNLIYRKKVSAEEDIDPKATKESSKKDYKFTIIDREDLNESDQKLVSFLFDKVGDGETFTTKKLKKYASSLSTGNKFNNSYNNWMHSVIGIGKKQNFFKSKAAAYIISTVLVIISFLMQVSGASFGVDYFLVYIAVIFAVILLIYTATIKSYNEKGTLHVKKWNAFKNFLKDFGDFAPKELPEVKLWERYLVYATIFGLAKKVQKDMNVKIKEFDETTQMTYTNTYTHLYLYDSISNSFSRAVSDGKRAYAASRANAYSSSSSGGGFGGGFSSGGGFGGGGGGGHGF